MLLQPLKGLLQMSSVKKLIPLVCSVLLKKSQGPRRFEEPTLSPSLIDQVEGSKLPRTSLEGKGKEPGRYY